MFAWLQTESAAGGQLITACYSRMRYHRDELWLLSLQDALELSQPLLLEIARHVGAVTPTELLSDPAFGSYHALLQLDCAAEQLQEPGSTEAAGAAVAVGCMSWAIQQGRVASAGLPPYVSPTGCAPTAHACIIASQQPLTSSGSSTWLSCYLAGS